jgi:hypothetical protein
LSQTLRQTYSNFVPWAVAISTPILTLVFPKHLKEDERKMRELLRQTLPYLVDRPLVEKFICWLADTADSDFIVDYVPDTSSSVMILSGDSGHGFKMFPIVGRWVDSLLNSKDGKPSISRWRWRVPKAKPEGESFHDVTVWALPESTLVRVGIAHVRSSIYVAQPTSDSQFSSVFPLSSHRYRR